MINSLYILVDNRYTVTIKEDFEGIGYYDIIVTHQNGYEQSFKGDDLEGMIKDIAVKLVKDPK